MSLSINTTLPRVEYTASASQTLFTYSFPIFADSDLEVYQSSSGDPGPGDILTLTTHYTVTGANTDSGGTVVLVTGATSGDTIVIRSKIPLDRSTNFTNNGTFEADDINRQLNELTQMVKQLQSEKVSRYAEDTPTVDSTLVVGSGTASTHAINKAQLDAHSFTAVSVDAPVVASVTALKALSTTTYTHAFLTGHSAALDGGGGRYVYSSGSAATDNNGTILAPDVGSGRWLRQFDGNQFDVRVFGAKIDNSTDDTTAFQAAVDAALTAGGGEVLIPNTGSDLLFTGITITAATDNRSKLIIKGGGATTAEATRLKCTSTTNVAIDVEDGGVAFKNFVLYADASRLASSTVTAHGIHFRGDQHANTLIQVYCEDVWVFGQPGDGWLLEGVEHGTFINCNGNTNGVRGFHLKDSGSGGRGISNTFIGCRATNNQLEGWEVESWFNTFINCQSLVNNQSSTLYAGAAQEVHVTGQNNKFINHDVEAQSQHAGTAGVDRPTTMYAYYVNAKDTDIDGGICAGFDTGVFITANGDYSRVAHTNFNNAGAGGNMTYAVDNAALNNVTIDLWNNSGSSDVDTLVRNKKFVGQADGFFSTPSVPRLGWGDPQELSGPGAISTTHAVTEITTTGTDAYTLANPSTNGLLKYVVMVVDGGTGTLTPTSLGNGTTITFDDVGDCAQLYHMDGKWFMVGGTATLA